MTDITLYKEHANKLSDLSGTFDDIGHAIAQLSRTTDMLAPLIGSVQSMLNNPGKTVSEVLDANPIIKYGLAAGASLLGLYFVSGIVWNGIEIYKTVNKN